MQTIKERWESYRSYGRKHGLNQESAEDFAQDAYIRFIEAGSEIVLCWVLADYIREHIGRTGTARSSAAFFDLNQLYRQPAMDEFDLARSILMILDEVEARGVSYRAAIKALAKHIGLTVPQVRLLARNLKLR